jgi:hypothetical protein
VQTREAREAVEEAYEAAQTREAGCCSTVVALRACCRSSSGVATAKKQLATAASQRTATRSTVGFVMSCVTLAE